MAIRSLITEMAVQLAWSCFFSALPLVCPPKGLSHCKMALVHPHVVGTFRITHVFRTGLNKVSPVFYCKLTLLWTEQGWWLLSKPDDKRLIRCSWHPESTSVTPRAAHDMERRTAVYRPRGPSHMPPASAGPSSIPAPQAGKAAWMPISLLLCCLRQRKLQLWEGKDNSMLHSTNF